MELLPVLLVGVVLLLTLIFATKVANDKKNAFLRQNETAEQKETREKATVFKARQSNITAIQLLFGVGVVAAISWWNWNNPSEQTVSTQGNEQTWIAEMQIRVKATLKDPSSAQFGGAWVVNVKGAPMVCGTVNSKNSFGGYSGAQGFFAGGDLIIMEESMKRGEWKKLCSPPY